jgi:hypothetical protein
MGRILLLPPRIFITTARNGRGGELVFAANICLSRGSVHKQSHEQNLSKVRQTPVCRYAWWQ